MADVRLVNKGRGEPLDGLIQQGRVSVELATEHAAELKDHGWAPAKTKELGDQIAQLEAAKASQVEKRDTSRGSTKTEHGAVNEAKAFARRLRNVLPIALRDAEVEGVDEQSFHAGGPLGRSTPKISAFLGRIRPAVEKLDAALAPYFGKDKASKLLDQAKKALDAADSAQEASLAGVPADTQKVYEAKGRVLELVEDLNRIAKNTFDGQATIAAKFNKDVLLRARRERAKTEPPANPPA